MRMHSRETDAESTAGASANGHQPFDERPLAISHAEIDAAIDRGEVAPLGQSLSWMVQYRDAWWVIYEHGWLRITDDFVAAELDGVAARLFAAETAQTRDTSCGIEEGSATDR